MNRNQADENRERVRAWRRRVREALAVAREAVHDVGREAMRAGFVAGLETAGDAFVVENMLSDMIAAHPDLSPAVPIEIPSEPDTEPDVPAAKRRGSRGVNGPSQPVEGGEDRPGGSSPAGPAPRDEVASCGEGGGAGAKRRARRSEKERAANEREFIRRQAAGEPLWGPAAPGAELVAGEQIVAATAQVAREGASAGASNTPAPNHLDEGK